MATQTEATEFPIVGEESIPIRREPSFEAGGTTMIVASLGTANTADGQIDIGVWGAGEYVISIEGVRYVIAAKDLILAVLSAREKEQS